MTAAPSYFDRKSTSSNRPGLSHLQQDPGSPHTPQRGFSSTFSSPSLSYRNEEEAYVFELGARHLFAGLAGEPCPRCTLSFRPDDSRRVGDYRQWLPNTKKAIREQNESEWGREHELWRMDLREVNLGLVEDKIERAVREAHTKYFLMDQRPRRLALVLPSVMPHQLLSSILSSIFLNFQFPCISLFSTPVIHTAAAGCRSGLVVDIGWAETIITATCEYREAKQTRTIRGTKQTLLRMARMLRRFASQEQNKDLEDVDAAETTIKADLEILEDVIARVAWCPRKASSIDQSEKTDKSIAGRGPRANSEQKAPSGGPTMHASTNTAAPNQLSQGTGNVDAGEDSAEAPDPVMSIPSPFSPGQNLQVPFSKLGEPVETTLLAKGKPFRELDDHDQPVHLLLFKTLLALPSDARAVCMSRIIITGGGSNIPGVKTRLLEEISAMVAERGWDGVEGKAADERRRRLKEISANQRAKPVLEPIDREGAAFQPQIYDDIDKKLDKERMKGTKPMVSGVVRGVESLGAWAGGSLVGSLKIKGVADIDRDTFLQHGLAGARKEAESSVPQHRKSIGPNLAGGIAERPGWTLGAWA